MKSVLISIHPKYCELIASGKKTIEVRKTRPKIETPFKCYIYQTNAKQVEHCDGCDITYYGNGKVIGEFVCNKTDFFFADYYDNGSADLTPSRLIFGLGNANSELAYLDKCCLTHDEIFDYIISGKYGYGWHITDLKIYDKPKELGEFSYPCPDKNYDTCYGCKYFYHDETEMCCKKEAVRPPQSWCYVDE